MVGREMYGWNEEVSGHAYKDVQGAEDIFLFFAPAETSQAKGVEFVRRISTRTQDRDETPALARRDAQAEAIADWGIPDMSKLARLAGIIQPTLVAKRRQRHHGFNRELVPAGWAHPQRRAHHLPGRQPRLSLPVPARVRGRRQYVPFGRLRWIQS